LQETKREGLRINGNTVIIIADCDISDDKSADSVMQVTVGKFGRVDYAVNCAGYPGYFGVTGEWGTEEFDKVVRINVRGTWLFMKAQLQQMKNQTPLEAKRCVPQVTSIDILVQRFPDKGALL
jgi:NAD(P)-dependent dehydrogenase (short-subunit alcohol dehydrogenase family)